jgi:hypothetical protein
MTTTASPVPPPAASVPRTADDNPYVGPRPMRRGEKIHGRASEIVEVRGLLVSNRVVLLYSPSGAGKTSLIEAGLLPQLAKRDFVVFPTIRVGHELPVAAGSGTNRYCLSVIASLEEGRDPDEQLAQEEVTSKDLGAYFDELAEAHPDGRLCLVFDQFEEVFTLNPVDEAAKRAFFEQLGSALKNRRYWVLIAMREDFIAQLDPYLDALPTQLRTRFRLGLLRHEAAIESVVATADQEGVEFREDAARKLVNDLRTIQVDHPDGPRGEQGPYVEPLQLQVVCRRLWDQPRPDPTTIGEADVRAGGGVNTALSDYYDAEIARVVGETRAGEREIRKWVKDDLITEDGFRKPVRKGPGDDGQAVLDRLTARHLLRRERRGGTNWYELTHDRFIEPIRASNRRFEEHRRAARVKRIMAVGLVVAVLAGIAIAVLIAGTGSDATQLTAESVDLPATGIVVELDQDGFTRFQFDPSDEEVIEATLRYDAESSGSTARLRLLGVDEGELGAEITASSLKRTTAVPGDDDVAPGAMSAPSGPALASQEEATAVVRRTVSADDESLVIEVASESGGSFVLSIEGAAGQVGPLEIGIDGGAIEPELTTAGDTVTAAIGGASEGDVVRVVVEPASDDFDPVLAVRTGDGEEIAFADLGGGGAEEVTTVSLPDADEYLVEVSGYEGSIGRFALTVERFDSSELAVGGSAEGAVANEERAVFAVSGEAGEGIRIVVTPDTGFDPMLRFTSSDGAASESDLNPDGVAESLTIVLGSGEQYVEVAGYEGSTGEFTIEIEPVDAIPLDVDETVSGTIDPSRPFETYRLRLPAGTSLESFDVALDDGLSAVVEISTSYGSFSYQADSEDEEFVEDAWQGIEFYEEEEWFVTVATIYGTSGSYELLVRTGS